ncbi:MAG: Rieske 2Fe-2S domain-containing protein [Xanthomonadaceae bacterium]|nr:Rieske 2Fe-2S domain-containing protein [Xanthomonadaceae bacterium]MDE2054893.1 Rieske 2Fe-2S domain-containing protein [Xanthomonadaceae bacterium]MDE2225856.1 Rieske 2Fe-2S domain-containing protein [Xanthomonadaceae bacterium]
MDSAVPDLFLCRLEDIPDGGVLGVDPPDPEGEPLLLARQGNSVRAWLNVCPHAGRRMDYAPGLFLVKDARLTCAVHGATFALREAGLCVAGPCRGQSLVAVRVQVRDGVVSRA